MGETFSTWPHLFNSAHICSFGLSTWLVLHFYRFLSLYMDQFFLPLELLYWINMLDEKFSSVSLLEKAMAPHSSTLAWKIPLAEEPGRLQSMGSRRVGHDWATSLSLFTFMHWRRKWQPTPVFLPGASQGWGSLVGCCLWGHTELDTTEAT